MLKQREMPDSNPGPYAFKTSKEVFAGLPVKKPKNGKEKKALEEKKKLEAEALAIERGNMTLTNEQALDRAESWLETVAV